MSDSAAWLLNGEQYRVYAFLKDLFSSGLLPYEKKVLASINENGLLVVGGEIIPFELLPYVFKNLYQVKVFNTSVSNASFDGNKYSLDIGENTYCFLEHANGTYEYLKNNKYHCVSGPAYSNPSKGIFKYFANGKLHRLDGPSLIELESKQEFYYLFGEKLVLHEYIARNPNSSTTVGFRENKPYSVTKLDDFALVEGVDGTVALMQKTEREGIDNFLVELVARPLKGFEVFYYPHLGESIANIHGLIAADWSQWSYDYDVAGSSLLFNDIDAKIRLTFDRKSKQMLFESSASGYDLEKVYDFSFSDTKAEEFPEIKVRHDNLGRLHCSDGPAIINPDGSEKYYLHGCHLSESRYSKKIYDKGSESFCWLNEDSELHTDSSFYPSQIFLSGEQRFHHNGLLHNSLLAAIVIPANDFNISRYFVYGNEISGPEFARYSCVSETIEYRDSFRRLHRENGPARMSFEQDGSYKNEYFYEGERHNIRGPAVECENGSFEYWVDGICHRDQGPAIWKSTTKILEYWRDGLLHNEAGPAVLIGLGSDRQYWLHGNQCDKLEFAGLIKSKSAGLSWGLQSQGEGKMANNDEGRMSQISGGVKSGFKRGGLKVVTGKAADALSKHIPLNDKMPMDKLVQLVLLNASAEVVEHAPVSMSEKIGLTPERKVAFGGTARKLSGEILGRDAVNLFSQLAPMLLENLQNLSAEDIKEAVNNFEIDTEVPVQI